MGVIRGQKYDLDGRRLERMMSCTNCLFVSGSMLLTTALVLVGISFFAPYWLSNVPAADETKVRNPAGESYLAGNSSDYPDRGLWAQCGSECEWFWEDGYRLQSHLFTPLKWHLATQILYITGAVFLLTAEIFARVQLCCDERTSVYWSLAFIVLLSAIVQLGAIATFGSGSSRDPYNAISDPRDTTPALGKGYYRDVGVYLGWCFWSAVVGQILSVTSGVLFIITALCVSRKN